MTNPFAAITLNLIPGLGSIRIRKLMEFFGTPEIILHADRRLLEQVPGIGPELARAIASWRTTTNADKELELADGQGVRIATLFDDDYPDQLRNIHDPPIVLYCKGNWDEPHGGRSISIVGSRMASSYGRMMTRRFASELAQAGIPIVSGLARGIDTEAHKAALDTQGTTIAVIGSGFNHLYPSENRMLADRITDGHGALVTEFPMDTRPAKTTFPMRNRIISAWSAATLVVEAPLRSGSLITAHQAMEQGRQVYALPGPADRPHSEGCHALIRDGAILVTKPGHIIDDLGWSSRPIQPDLFEPETPRSRNPLPAPALDERERLVLDGIDRGFNHLDALSSFTSLRATDIAACLARLQIRKLILPAPGGTFIKT